MPEAVAAPAAPATPPPVSPADLQRAEIARENGTTYDASSRTFAEAPQEPAADGTTPATPASGDPAQNAATSEGQDKQNPTPVDGGGDESDPAAAADVSGEDAESASQQQPGKNHVARRIDKLTRENAELRRAFAQLAQRTQPPQQQPQVPQAPADPKPDPSRYTDVAQFIADTSAWQSRQEAQRVVGQVFGALAQHQAQQQQVQQAAAAVQEFNQRVEAGAKEIKDFAQVTGANADVEVAPHVATSIMQGVENPAVVLYHLAKNPAEVAKLNSMPPAKVAVRLGAIEANARRPAQPSNAPKPGVPVAAKGSIPSAISDDMSMEQFVAARKGK